jgi:hypothetical protein
MLFMRRPSKGPEQIYSRLLLGSNWLALACG